MWYLGGIGIIVTDIETNNNQIIARLFPYNSPTVHQIFGYEGPVSTIVCKIHGGAASAIQAFTTTGDSYELIGPTGSFGNFLVKNINFQLDKSSRQTIFPTLPIDTWIYTGKIEVYKE